MQRYFKLKKSVYLLLFLLLITMLFTYVTLIISDKEFGFLYKFDFNSSEQTINCEKKLFYYKCNISYYNNYPKYSIKKCNTTKISLKPITQKNETIYYEDSNNCSTIKLNTKISEVKQVFALLLIIVFIVLTIKCFKKIIHYSHLYKHEKIVIKDIKVDLKRIKTTDDTSLPTYKIEFNYTLDDGIERKFKTEKKSNRVFDTVTLVVDKKNYKHYEIFSPFENIDETK